MPSNLPVTGVIPISEMKGEDNPETLMLRDMESRARKFINDFEWCRGIREFYFGAGIGGVVAVFLAHIQPSKPSVDEFLWIVVGDIPSAYLVVDDSPSPKQAIESYVWEMRKWVELARQGSSSEDVIPVNVPATPEWAEALAGRLDFIETKIIPHIFFPPGPDN